MSAFKRCMASLDISNVIFRKEKKLGKRGKGHTIPDLSFGLFKQISSRTFFVSLQVGRFLRLGLGPLPSDFIR